jgi:hypothetical protein
LTTSISCQEFGVCKKFWREKIKELVRESGDDFRQNWRENVMAALGQLKKEMESEVGKLDQKAEETAEEIETKKKVLPVDEHGCRAGYELDQKVGKCAQKNCNEITHAHWSYVLDCVCGSSGSIDENPKDPNKECSYTPEYESCPGCVYACVHLDEDCPLEGIGGN